MPPKNVTNEDIDRLRDSIDRWRVPLQASIDSLKKTVYGNGDPGMDENVRHLLQIIKDEKDNRQWLFRTTAGTALATLIMLIINGAIYFFRILPVLDKLKP